MGKFGTSIVNNIETYRATLGAGHRGNQFAVSIDIPPVLKQYVNSYLVDGELNLKILCHATSMPAERTIEPIDLPYGNEYLRLAGAKSAPEDWEVTFRNDDNATLRNILAEWMNFIQDVTTGRRALPGNPIAGNNNIGYKSTAYIAMTDGDKKVKYQRKLVGLFPTTVPAIELSQENAEITETAVTFAYDRSEPITIDGLPTNFKSHFSLAI